MDLFDLFAKISLDTNEYESGINTVESESSKAQSSIENIGNTANSTEGNLDSLGTEATSTGGDLNSMGGSADSAGSDLNTLGSTANNTSDHIDNMGDEAGDASGEIRDLGNTANDTSSFVLSLGDYASDTGGDLSGLGDEASSAGGDISGMGTEAGNTEGDLSSVGGMANSTAGMFDSLGGSANGATGELSGLGDEMSGDVTSGGDSASSAIGGVSDILGAFAAGGLVAGAVASIGEVATAFYDVATEAENSRVTIAQGTGATGEDLENLETSARTSLEGVSLASQTNLGQVSSTLAELNTRFGITDEELETTTSTMSDFAVVTGQNSVQAVDDIADVMSYWGLDLEDMPGLLDNIVTAEQGTKASAQEYETALYNNAGAFDSLGYSIDDALAFLATYSANGGEVTDVTTMLRTAVSNLSETTDDVPGAFQQAIDAIGECDTVAEALGTQVGDTGLTVEDVFGSRNAQKLATNILTGQTSIEDWTSALEDNQGALEQTVEDSTTMQDSISGSMQRIKSDVSEMFTPAVETVVTGAADMLDGVVSFAEDTGTKLSEWNENATEWLYNQFGTTTEGAIESVHNLSESIDEKFEAAGETIKGWGESAVQNISDFCDDAGTFFTEDVPAALDTMTGFFEDLPGKVGGFLDDIVSDASDFASDFAEKATTAAGDFIDNVSGGISDGIETVKGAAKDLGEKVSKKINSVFGKGGEGDMEAEGEEAADNVGKGISGKNLDEYTESQTNKISSFFSKWFGKGGEGDANAEGDEIASDVGTGIEDNTSAEGNTETLGNKIINKFKGFKGDAQDAGTDIVEGAAEGILASDEAEDAMEQQSNGILGKLRDIFDMHSPSKVMEGEGENMTEGMVQGFIDLADEVTDKFQDMADMIWDWSGKQITTMQQTGVMLEGAFVTGMKDMPTDVQTDVLDLVQKAVESWGTSIKQSASETAKKFAENVISGIKSLPSDFKKVLEEVTSNFSGWSGTIEKSATETAKSFLNNITSGIKPLPTDVKKILDDVASTEKTWSETITKVATSTASSFLKNWNAGIKSMPSDTKSVLDDVTAKVTDFSDKLNTKMETAGEKAIKSFTSGMNSQVSAAKEKAADIAEKVLEKFDITSKMEKYGSKDMSSFKSGLNSGGADAKQKASDIAEKVLEKFDMADKMERYGERAMSNFRSGLSSGANDVYTKATDIKSGVVDRFDIQTSMYNKGNNAGWGFYNGLSSVNSSICSLANTMAGNVVGAFNFRLQIGSPSRVLYKTGRNTGEGFENGLESTEDEIEDVVDDITDIVTGADFGSDLNEALSDVSDSTSIGAYSSTSTRSEADRRLDDVIDLLEAYLPALAKMQMVTDTGALVGELAAPMDTALGKLENRKKRMSA